MDRKKNRASPIHHGHQATSSMSANAKGSSSHAVNTQQRETPDAVVKNSSSTHSQEAPTSGYSNEQKWPSLSNDKTPCTKGSNRASASLEAEMSRDGLDSIPGSACRPYGTSHDTHMRGESLKNRTDQATGQRSRGILKNVVPQLKETSVNDRSGDIQSVSVTPKIDKGSSNNTDENCDKHIDICPVKSGVPKLKISLLDRNREKRKDLERTKEDPHPIHLRPGMVLLKNFISHADQIKIIRKCRELGLGIGGFYKPGYDDGAKLRLHMMCLGKNWDPQSRSYEEIRSVDGAKPPIIPDEFRKLVSDAIQASRQGDRVRKPSEDIPLMEPDICIVNFYTNTGKLGLHQDRDESPESLKRGLPVVSFSIGDSAEFLYGDERDEDKAEKVELKSGDVVIFGGKSRLIYHGVPSITPNSAPKFLDDEANFRPGRLNLTFRKY